MFRRHFWIVVLNVLSVTAYLHADALRSLLGARLAPDASRLALIPMHAAPPSGSASKARDLSPAVIFARNAFDSVTGPLRDRATALVPGGVTQADFEDPMDAPPCQGVKVVAIAASTDPDWSLATLSTSGAPAPLMRRRGGALAGKTVTFIAWDRVWLADVGDSSKLCQTALGDTALPAEAKPVTQLRGLVQELASGIHVVSPTQRSIERRVVEKIVEHQGGLFVGVSLAPDPQGGFRLSGIKPDSILAVLGLKNDDRLERMNGYDLGTPDQALEAYARLGSARHLVLQVRRGGAEQNLDYDITD